jgi:hypothetical protein
VVAEIVSYFSKTYKKASILVNEEINIHVLFQIKILFEKSGLASPSVFV